MSRQAALEEKRRLLEAEDDEDEDEDEVDMDEAGAIQWLTEGECARPGCNQRSSIFTRPSTAC